MMNRILITPKITKCLSCVHVDRCISKYPCKECVWVSRVDTIDFYKHIHTPALDDRQSDVWRWILDVKGDRLPVMDAVRKIDERYKGKT